MVLEAMSQGVPVITTPNSGSSQFISDGDDGFIVPIRDVEAIVQRLESLVQDRDGVRCDGASRHAQGSASFLGAIPAPVRGDGRSAVTNSAGVSAPLLQSSTRQVQPAC